MTIGVDKYLALAPDVPIRPRGESGMMISDLMPHLAEVADDLCLLRAVHTDNEAHAPATLQLHTGVSIDVRPSMGSWFSYGLGTENQNLPSFVTIHPDLDVRTYGAGFLPAAHQGTPVDRPEGRRRTRRSSTWSTPTSSAGRAAAAARLRAAAEPPAARAGRRRPPDGRDDRVVRAGVPHAGRDARAGRPLGRDRRRRSELYGIGEPATDQNGRACLLARRLSEAGVRFVQVTIGGWDHHGNIRGALPKSCAGSDKPVAGLIQDLKSRGLLDDTLVVWSRRVRPHALEPGPLGHVADRDARPRASARQLLHAGSPAAA